MSRARGTGWKHVEYSNIAMPPYGVGYVLKLTITYLLFAPCSLSNRTLTDYCWTNYINMICTGFHIYAQNLKDILVLLNNVHIG